VKQHNKRRIATLLRRAPWIGHIAQALWRVWQPWVTVGAVGVIFNDDGRLLVVEHVFHPKFPWGLPGGWMARYEDPDETVRREVYEETALRIRVVKPLLIMRTAWLPRHLDLAYLCYASREAGEIRLSNELLAYQWIDPAQCPPMALFHERAVKAALAERAATQVMPSVTPPVTPPVTP
jgi:8-oxo-dGTP diphosphatase